MGKNTDGVATKTEAKATTWSHPKEEALAFEHSRAWYAYRGCGRRAERRTVARGRRVGGNGGGGN